MTPGQWAGLALLLAAVLALGRSPDAVQVADAPRLPPVPGMIK